jgi:AGCS family alanine or glycine:cation symporter
MEILARINSLVWGVPTLVLILGVGLYLTWRTGFGQLRLFPRAVKEFAGMCTGKEKGGFHALCTALAATVGTGNIAGVAGAIALGGPGSIFWMWVSAILGMITKFAEAVLSVHFRQRTGEGYAGGPMYIIEQGMGKAWRPLAVLYCFFGTVAAFGMGNATQINAVAESINGIGQGTALGGVVAGALALVAAWSLLGGAKRIGNVAAVLVPVASVCYILLCLGALLEKAAFLPSAMESIFVGAFSLKAVTGGALGSAFLALRVGTSRGVFTNEAGMGTAAMAHGTSPVAHPAQQGLMGIMEVFLDTILICTMTALVILTSGVPIPYGFDEGAALTVRAFAATYGSWVSIPIALFLCCFAFATMVGWGFYGLECARYLFGACSHKPFVLLQTIAAMASLVLGTGTVWLLAEIVNGLMAIPNLIALAALMPVTVSLYTDYRKQSARRRSVQFSMLFKGRETTAPPDS